MARLILFLLLLNSTFLFSASREIERFFEKLIYSNDDLSSFVFKSELEKANRLGINYENVKNKFLISYDIDQEVKEAIKKKKYKYELQEAAVEDRITKITFIVRNIDYSKDFYFKSNKLISPTTYFTREWRKAKSNYFNFYLSDPFLFNSYSIDLLDNYVDNLLDLLNVSATERRRLQREKINYILCKDEEEIKAVTGFATRGIFILAYDEIITTFNTHFHELAHLLINYKLKTLPLYTLPFFQEGFATAVGGRGGQSRNVLIDVGHFLHQNKFIPFNSILSNKEFHSEDASLTYPVSALYNFFFMNEYGTEQYLAAYKKYSGSFNHVSSLTADSVKLPAVADFNNFIDSYDKKGGVEINIFTENDIKINENISDAGDYYKIKLRKNILFSESAPQEEYKSKKFKEMFPNVDYRGEKYLIMADAREINVYNLYTNNLIGSYSAGFSTGHESVPSEEGYFIFYVKKDLFDEEIKGLIISEI